MKKIEIETDLVWEIHPYYKEQRVIKKDSVIGFNPHEYKILFIQRGWIEFPKKEFMEIADMHGITFKNY